MSTVKATSDSITAAGIVAYAIKDNQVQLLLANHQGLAFYRGYGAFGGGIEENETIAEAALREFHEETRCAFKDQKIILSEDKRLQLSSYVSYIIELPYFDEAVLLQRQQEANCKGAVFRERGVLRWYGLALIAADKQTLDIEVLLESPPWHIWPASKKVIEKAIKRGLIPLQFVDSRCEDGLKKVC